MRNFLSQRQLPDDLQRAKRIAASSSVVRAHRRHRLLHRLQTKSSATLCCSDTLTCTPDSGPFARHFSGEKLYKALVRHWYWPSMYSDVVSHCTACPQCAVVHSSGRLNRPPLHPIPVQCVFQIVGVDIMDLPKTEAGNKHVGLSL